MNAETISLKFCLCVSIYYDIFSDLAFTYLHLSNIPLFLFSFFFFQFFNATSSYFSNSLQIAIKLFFWLRVLNFFLSFRNYLQQRLFYRKIKIYICRCKTSKMKDFNNTYFYFYYYFGTTSGIV